ncbi:MAG: hypothetical protein JWP25_6524 [Bradyrhizobium sp.]|jgi:hypothetical protein|nr:hypothetical protein [Bradyrhizobium sp.]
MVVGVRQVRQVDGAEEQANRIKDGRLADIATTENDVYHPSVLDAPRSD